MNYLKSLVFGAAIFSTSLLFAQKEVAKVKDIAEFTTTKKYTTELNGVKTVYRIKVLEHQAYPIRFDAADKGMKEQKRLNTPAYITKKVYIDDDSDKYYDKSIVIRYMRAYEGKFEILPMRNGEGVGVKIEGMEPEEITKAGYYLSDTDDNDYFVVEEFNTL